MNAINTVQVGEIRVSAEGIRWEAGDVVSVGGECWVWGNMLGVDGQAIEIRQWSGRNWVKMLVE